MGPEVPGALTRTNAAITKGLQHLFVARQFTRELAVGRPRPIIVDWSTITFSNLT